MENGNGNITYFGQETEFDGVLEFTDSLVITGKFHGTIKATGSLEIDKSAVCEVDDMTVRSVVISGRVSGNIHASDRIEMCSGSVITGNVDTAKLRIADDVEYDGQVTMLDAVPETDLFSTASAEFKKSLLLKVAQAR